MLRTRLSFAFCALALVTTSTATLAQSAPAPATSPNPVQGRLPPPPPGVRGDGPVGKLHPAHPPTPPAAPIPPPPPGIYADGRPSFVRSGPDPAFSVLQTLNALQRIYEEAGRGSELPALYNEVLSKTHNPMLRQEVYRRLAQAQLKPSHVDAAIATLRKSLDEGLAAEAGVPPGPLPHRP